MDSNVASALISGICSIISAFGAVYLKEYMDARKTLSTEVKPTQAPIEVLQAEVSPSSFKRNSRTFWRPLFIIIGSFVFGLVTRSLRPIFNSGTHWESLIALIVLILFALAISIFHRRHGYQIGFQLENFAMWTGWASGWSLFHGSIWGDVLVVTIAWWFGCALVGGLLVSIRRNRGAQQRH
ncbi:MAG: hypothetical protein OEL83_10330 [Desulforhopalus sp.]|nr:hypothetical protein [Desulforhopalus sp.]